jgi:hypothetical protein
LRSREDDLDDDDDEMSTMASPLGIHGKASASRGRSNDIAGDGARSASRSRSRSSSVLRRLIGGGNRKDKSKPSDDGMSTSGMTSVASTNTTNTKNTKIKRIKKIRKDEGSSRRSSSCDRTRNSSCDRTRSSSSDCPHHHSISGPVAVKDEGSPLDQKLRKSSKMKYKSRRIKDSGGVDSDGDYGAADSDGDIGSINGTRSIGSEVILSGHRKVRRKKKHNKSNDADDETLGSGKNSLPDRIDYHKAPKGRGMHESKVAAIPEPPMSPHGEKLKSEMDSLFPSPKSEKKKLPRIKRKGKPDISMITFEKETFSPIVDRTPGARPSDYKKSDSSSTANGRPPLPEYTGDADTAGSWRNEKLGHRRKSGKGDSSSMNKYNQNHDSGLSLDGMTQEVPSSYRSNKSLRSYGRGTGDSDTVLSMTDTVSSLNMQLEDKKEETKDLQKQLISALSNVASLNEELRLHEGTVTKANAKIAEVNTELGRKQVENSDLRKTLDEVQQNLLARDERIEKLKQVVGTQLDTIDFLEVRLEQTEDELFKMEDELKALDEGGLLDQAGHTKSLLKRKESIHKDMLTRKGSIRVQTEESRSVLGAGSVANKNSCSAFTDDLLEQRERKLLAREKKLDEWEKNLVKVDVQSKQWSDQTVEEAGIKAKLQLMEKRERRMEENLDALLQEKEVLSERVRELECVKNESVLMTSSDREILTLREKISQLESSNKTLVAETEALLAAKANDTSKLTALESDKQDLRVKLDHVRSTAIKDEEEHHLRIQSLQEQLCLARGNGGDDHAPGSCGQVEIVQSLKKELAERDLRISTLEDKIKRPNTTNEDDDDNGKDLLIRELQNQLVAAKKEAHDLSSGDQVKRLRAEIKTLKQGYNDVKKRMKSADITARVALKKKDESIQAMKNDIAKLQRDLERLEKREKNLRIDGKVEEGDLLKHVADLEDEIDHWKSANADLENELESLKAEFSGFKLDAKSSKDDVDDEGSVGSLQSLNSYMSEHQGMEMSSHSVSSLFFVSDSTSVRSHRSISVAAPFLGDEPTTPSQRAIRSVSTLWSKMRNEPSQTTNPAIPYGAGILDDD